MKIGKLLTAVMVLLICSQIFAMKNDILRPSSIIVDEKNSMYILSGWYIYKYDLKSGNFNEIYKKIPDMFGYDKSTLILGSYGLIGFNIQIKENRISYSFDRLYKSGVKLFNPQETQRAYRDFEKYELPKLAKYLKCEPKLEEIIQRVIYPKHIAVGPEGKLYVIGEDIFRKNFKLGILDPNDGHPISVFSAVDMEAVKTRAKRLEDVINKESFGGKDKLLEYVCKSREIINGDVSRIYLDKILDYVPYDKSYEAGKWSKYRWKIIDEWNKGEIVYPEGLAVDSVGNFYITDSGEVKIFNRGGDYIRSFGGRGSDDGQFKVIWGIALDEQNGCIYATDNFGTPFESPQMRVQKFTKDGKFLLKWGGKKFKGIRIRWWLPMFVYEYELFDPVGIAVDSKGDVYVLCSSPAEVKKFTPEGKLIMKWGKAGKRPGEFRWPQAIAIDKDNNIYIADTDNNRIQKFDSEGKYLMEIK